MFLSRDIIEKQQWQFLTLRVTPPAHLEPGKQCPQTFLENLQNQGQTLLENLRIRAKNFLKNLQNRARNLPKSSPNGARRGPGRPKKRKLTSTQQKRGRRATGSPHFGEKMANLAPSRLPKSIKNR